MNPIQKAEETLGYLKSNGGTLTPRQSREFAAEVSRPCPPSRPPWWAPWRWPQYVRQLEALPGWVLKWEREFDRSWALRGPGIQRDKVKVVQRAGGDS